MRTIRCTTATVFFSMVLAGAAVADGAQSRDRYTGSPVSDGGTIAGIVRYDGEAPAPERVDVTTTEDVCHSDSIYSEKLVVAENGGVRWAVVSIKGIKAGKPFPETTDPDDKPLMDQKGCVFDPHVVVVPVGKPIRLLNSDGVLHNVHTWPKKNRSKNIAMPGTIKEMSTKFRRPERIRVTCDIHPWMEAWCIAVEHPYNAVTSERGEFELTDIPPGTYTLELWHETLGIQERTVTVEAGKTTEIEFVANDGSNE